MVDENLMKLELKRLLQSLTGQNDNVYSLERQKLDLKLSMQGYPPIPSCVYPRKYSVTPFRSLFYMYTVLPWKIYFSKRRENKGQSRVLFLMKFSLNRRDVFLV